MTKYSYGEEIPMTTHTEVKDAAVDPTSYNTLGFFDVYYGFEAVRAQATAKAPARTAVRTQF